jgi:hypothetical protein
LLCRAALIRVALSASGCVMGLGWDNPAYVPSFYLPPGAAIFLDTIREHSSVPDSLVAKPLREAFRRLQEDTSTACSIADLYRHKQRFANLLNELRTPDPAGRRPGNHHRPASRDNPGGHKPT